MQADEDLAEEVHHPDRDVGDHEKLAFDIVIECVCLQDRDRLVLTKVELLAIRDRLATVLESRYGLWNPLELLCAFSGISFRVVGPSLSYAVHDL